MKYVWLDAILSSRKPENETGLNGFLFYLFLFQLQLIVYNKDKSIASIIWNINEKIGINQQTIIIICHCA